MDGELLSRLKSWCIPGGEDAARPIRGLHIKQRGELRSGRSAPWTTFEAEEFVDATRSAFRWEARMGGNLLTSVHVTDAYEDGHGRLVIRKGPVQLKKLTGPEVDKGELQRYLAYVSLCPAMLVSNPSLEFTEIGPQTLRITDIEDKAGAYVQLEIADDGRPVLARAVRPMTVGSRIVPTAWSATGTEPEEHEGLRICRRLEGSWIPPEGEFVYIRIRVLSVASVMA